MTKILVVMFFAVFVVAMLLLLSHGGIEGARG